MIKKISNSILVLFFLFNCENIDKNIDADKKALTNLVKEEKFEQAIDFLNKLMDKYPKEDEFPAILSGILHGLGRDREAVDSMIKAIKLNPNIGLHHANLGFIFYKNNDCKMAIPPFRKAIELGGYPEPCMLYYASGVCNSQKGNVSIANSHLSKFISDCKGDKLLTEHLDIANRILNTSKN